MSDEKGNSFTLHAAENRDCNRKAEEFLRLIFYLIIEVQEIISAIKIYIFFNFFEY